nr:probable sugar phosphate/phosphate translocator At5g04160 [Ipomoea batatas]
MPPFSLSLSSRQPDSHRQPPPATAIRHRQPPPFATASRRHSPLPPPQVAPPATTASRNASHRQPPASASLRVPQLRLHCSPQARQFPAHQVPLPAVGATTPFFTALFAYLITSKREAWVTYTALVPVVAGVVIATGIWKGNVVNACCECLLVW